MILLGSHILHRFEHSCRSDARYRTTVSCTVSVSSWRNGAVIVMIHPRVGVHVSAAQVSTCRLYRVDSLIWIIAEHDHIKIQVHLLFRSLNCKQAITLSTIVVHELSSLNHPTTQTSIHGQNEVVHVRMIVILFHGYIACEHDGIINFIISDPIRYMFHTRVLPILILPESIITFTYYSLAVLTIIAPRC